MDEIESELNAAADALQGLAAGPGLAAADALAGAFGAAGEEIQRALGAAADSGALDFNRMTEAILRDLSRIAAEAVLGSGGAQQGATLNMNFAPGTDHQGFAANAGTLSAMLARMVSQGGRFL